jgi:hypothetical protein
MRCLRVRLGLFGACAQSVRSSLQCEACVVLTPLPSLASMFSILESVAFDTGYAGSNGLEPQSWVNGNGTSYIYFGSGEFDGQGSGHDFYGTLYMPPSGYVNSCDGGRSHTYCDYRQE